MSLFYNLCFAIELFLDFLIETKGFFNNSWNILSVIIILSSIGSAYLQNNSTSKDYLFLKSCLLSVQVFRLFLIIKEVQLLKKIFITLKTSILNSLSIITLFFLVLLFYSIIGKKF